MQLLRWGLLCITSVAIFNQAHALPNQLSSWLSSSVASFSVGPVWANKGQTQTFYLAPEIEKTYAASNSTQALADAELFWGVKKSLAYQLQGQLGLAVATTSNAGLSGNIWDDASPTFDNYTYDYKLRHTHVAVKAKVLADRGFVVTPWLSGSIGVGFNQARNFTNTPKIFEAVMMPNFTDHTTTSFTYTVGAGLARNITKHVQVGLGYEFADWGKSRLNAAPDQTLGSGLALSHFYTNGLLFNFTYLA